MQQGTDLQFKLPDDLDPKTEVEMADDPVQLLLFSILLTQKRLRTWLERDIDLEGMKRELGDLSQRNTGGERGDRRPGSPPPPEKKNADRH